MTKRKKLGDIPKLNGKGTEELREMVAGSETETKSVTFEPDWPGQERKSERIVDTDGKKKAQEKLKGAEE